MSALHRSGGRAGTEGVAAVLLVLFYAVGTLAHLIAATRPLMVLLTPCVLVVLGLGVFVLSVPPSGGVRPRFLVWAISTAAATFAIEVVGVATGEIFGGYEYGEVLGIKLAGVPIVIGFNWTLVILGAAEAAERIPGTAGRRLVGLRALVTGLIAAVFDLAMEPTAVGLGYWRWSGGAVPIRNYLVWFVLAAAAGLAYRAARARTDSILPIVYLVAQLVFFIVLNIFHVGTIS